MVITDMVDRNAGETDSGHQRYWETDMLNRNIGEQICSSETLVIRDIHDHTYSGEQA